MVIDCEVFAAGSHRILGLCHPELIPSGLVVLGHRLDQMSLLLLDLVPLLRTVRSRIKGRIKVLGNSSQECLLLLLLMIWLVLSGWGTSTMLVSLLELGVRLARVLAEDGHGHRVVHLRQVIVYACILFDCGVEFLVDLGHVEEHLAVDVLGARNLVMVQFRSFKHVVNLVEQWVLHAVELGDDLEHLLVDVFRNLLHFLK